MDSTYSMNVLDIGMIQVLAGRSRRCEISSDYSLRTAYNLKLIAYFWNFPFNILGPRLTASNKLGKEKLQMRGTICKHFSNNLKNDIILSNKTSQVYILLLCQIWYGVLLIYFFLHDGRDEAGI